MSYPRFIEVHGIEDSQALSLNVEHIAGFGNGYVIFDDDTKKTGRNVAETYDELKQLIHDAGCAIAKRDPRLDHTKPLTMEELKTMIGEPVWNKNAGEWALVSGHINDEIIFTAANDSYWYNADDLIKFPMYRMKVTE